MGRPYSMDLRERVVAGTTPLTVHAGRAARLFTLTLMSRRDHAHAKGGFALQGGLDSGLDLRGDLVAPVASPSSLALLRPARTRSWIMARSNSAKTPNI